MRKLLIAVLLLGSGLSLAQGVRSLGMGGVTLPGPWASGYNPAYTAYPADNYGPVGGIGLPLGLVNLAVRPEASPVYYFTDFDKFQNNFDLIAFLDQLAHPYEFEFTMPQSPSEIVFHINADGVSVTDANGDPIYLISDDGESPAIGSGDNDLPLRRPFFEVHLPTTSPNYQASFGAFISVGGLSVDPSDNLVVDLANGSLQPNTTYSLSAAAAAEAGITGRLSFAAPLPAIPGFDGRIYIGGQIDGFYGIVRDDAKVTATFTTDGDGIPGTVGYSSESFYVYPDVGNGFGGRLDFGLAVDYQSATFGLGARNLYSYEQWKGVLRTSSSDGSVSEYPKTIVTTEFNPSIFANAAYAQQLPAGMTMLYGVDFGYFNGNVSTHAGLELQESIFRLRGGVGYDGGLKFGLGGGIALPHVSLDAALTSHQAIFTKETIYGLAASLGIYF